MIKLSSISCCVNIDPIIVQAVHVSAHLIIAHRHFLFQILDERDPYLRTLVSSQNVRNKRGLHLHLNL